MRFFVTAIFFALTLGASGAALAATAEVRDVALANNCPPKKIEIYKQALGGGGDTVYRVQCTLPKTAGATTTEGEDAQKPPDALLIGCKQNLCDLLRPVSMGEQK